MLLFPVDNTLWLISIVGATLATICWSYPFIIFKLIKFKLYHITDPDIVATLINQIKISGSYKSNNKERGIFYGRWYIGSIRSDEYDDEKTNIYILCSQTMYNRLSDLNMLGIHLSQTNGNNNDKTDLNTAMENIKSKYKFISIYNFNLTAYHGNISEPRKMIIPYNKYSTEQQTLINLITSAYNKYCNHTCIVYGQPGSGKSVLALALAQKFESSLCMSYDPCLPGMNFNYLYTIVNPTKDKPLIVLIDEIDILLHKIQNETVETHRNCIAQIKNKHDWNKFFDNINRKFYPFVIFILTTNQNKSYFDNIDPAYTRKGRIDAIYELVKTEEFNDPYENIDLSNDISNEMNESDESDDNSDDELFSKKEK
jgi:hypothetical protein